MAVGIVPVRHLVTHAVLVRRRRELAEKGVLTICPDNAGMGERADPEQGGCDMTWRKLNMLGYDMTGFRAYDLIRAVDLLEELQAENLRLRSTVHDLAESLSALVAAVLEVFQLGVLFPAAAFKAAAASSIATITRCTSSRSRCFSQRGRPPQW